MNPLDSVTKLEKRVSVIIFLARPYPIWLPGDLARVVIKRRRWLQITFIYSHLIFILISFSSLTLESYSLQLKLQLEQWPLTGSLPATCRSMIQTAAHNYRAFSLRHITWWTYLQDTSSYLPRNSFSQIIRLKSTLLRKLSDDRLRVPLKRSLAQFSKRDPLIIRRLPALVFFRTRVFNKLVLMRLPCSSLWFLISIYSLRDWVSLFYSFYFTVSLFTAAIYSRCLQSFVRVGEKSL